MLKMIRLLMVPILLLTVAACGTEKTTAVQADNTARNADSPAAQTPLDQAENEADLQISANIRKAIVADGSLSTNAQNVKIITSSGVVTLRGPVNSQQEKAAIEAIAKTAGGATEVNNLLEVE